MHYPIIEGKGRGIARGKKRGGKGGGTFGTLGATRFYFRAKGGEEVYVLRGQDKGSYTVCCSVPAGGLNATPVGKKGGKDTGKIS